MIHVGKDLVLELGLKDKKALRGKPNPVWKIVRYPDVCAPTAKSTLAKKRVFYSSSISMIKQKNSAVLSELRYKGYPRAWWATPFKMGLKKFELPECEWREMHPWFREEHKRV